MQISLEWLGEYVELPRDPMKFKEDLTMAGLLVESLGEHGGTVVLDMEVTSNRPDCLSHIGVAREVAALYGKELRLPEVARNLQLKREGTPYSIEILDSDLCPRYVGLVLDGLQIAPSPPWMQRRLEAAGMRPLNNIVDITNYVLLEMGHPLHAFDFAKLRGGKIVVARAGEGQEIVTLDGITRALDADMLLINDGEGPVAIAGVMGGLNSEISETTHTVLLECAYFQPASVRRTSKRLGLSTEASYRFERGADWENTVPAIARTCRLIEQLAAGRISGSLRDVYPQKLAAPEIELRRERTEKLLGVPLRDDFIERTLRSLNFAPRRVGDGRWQVRCPTYRADMELEADLVEEIARFHGYANIPTTVPRGGQTGRYSALHPYESTARSLLLGLGHSEAVNLSFARESDHREFPPRSGDRLAVRNPLNEDLQFMRTSLVPGLVRAAKHNFNHDQRQVRLFEIGRVYRQGEGGKAVEGNALGILATGDPGEENWMRPAEAYNFFHLKGVLTAFLTGMRAATFEVLPARETSWLNPTDAASLSVAGQCLGVLGSLHPVLEEKYKLRQPVYIAELDFDELCRHGLSPVRYDTLPRYPAAQRDISFLVPRGTAFGDIRAGIDGLAIRELVRLELIDVYEGEKIPTERLSLTLRLTFQDPEVTLTVDRVESFRDNIVNYLLVAHGAEIR